VVHTPFICSVISTAWHRNGAATEFFLPGFSERLNVPMSSHGDFQCRPVRREQWGDTGRSPADQYSAWQEVPNSSHINASKKSPRVNFKMLRIAEGDWQIVAECPGTETHYIKGLKSKEDVDEWLAGTRRIAWLRSQGYAK
jgi:hypothetical protein